MVGFHVRSKWNVNRVSWHRLAAATRCVETFPTIIFFTVVQLVTHRRREIIAARMKLRDAHRKSFRFPVVHRTELRILARFEDTKWGSPTLISVTKSILSDRATARWLQYWDNSWGCWICTRKCLYDYLVCFWVTVSRMRSRWPWPVPWTKVCWTMKIEQFLLPK